MKRITLENLPDFIRGTAILGTGGGGDPYVGRLMLEQELTKCGGVDLIDPSDVPDDMFAISVACMGAPTVFVEKLPNADATVKAMRRIEKEVGRKFNAIIPLEAGGVNATLPLVVAAQMGLPVVDGDGMGRAFPEFQMTTFNIYGVNCSPFVMADDFENTIVLETDSALRTERYGRAVCVKMGGIAQVASYAMTGEEVRRTCVPRTVSLAVDIGKRVRELRIEGKEDICEGLAAYFATSQPPRFARVLFDGKVQDVIRGTENGWTVGNVTMSAAGDSSDEMFLSFRNEYSLAKLNGKTVAIVPDLLFILDRETGEAITTETLRYGQRVKVIGVAATEEMRTPEALEVIGPKASNITEPFIRLEDLAWNGDH